jgi:hypothetical protein
MQQVEDYLIPFVGERRYRYDAVQGSSTFDPRITIAAKAKVVTCSSST